MGVAPSDRCIVAGEVAKRRAAKDKQAKPGPILATPRPKLDNGPPQSPPGWRLPPGGAILSPGERRSG